MILNMCSLAVQFKLFGDAIVATITEVLESFGIKDALVDAVDRGALEWIIRARMQSACCKATGTQFDWRG